MIRIASLYFNYFCNYSFKIFGVMVIYVLGFKFIIVVYKTNNFHFFV